MNAIANSHFSINISSFIHVKVPALPELKAVGRAIGAVLSEIDGWVTVGMTGRYMSGKTTVAFAAAESFLSTEICFPEDNRKMWDIHFIDEGGKRQVNFLDRGALRRQAIEGEASRTTSVGVRFVEHAMPTDDPHLRVHVIRTWGDWYGPTQLALWVRRPEINVSLLKQRLEPHIIR